MHRKLKKKQFICLYVKYPGMLFHIKYPNIIHVISHIETKKKYDKGVNSNSYRMKVTMWIIKYDKHVDAKSKRVNVIGKT